MVRFSKILFYTPQKRWPIIVSAIVIVLASPILNIVNWYNPQRQLVFVPIGLDCLTITIREYLTYWLIFGSPIFLIIATVIIIALIKYPSAVPLFGFNANRPIWSIVWTIVFLVAVIYFFLFYVEKNSTIKLIERLYTLVVIYFLFQLRSSMIYSKIFLSKGVAA
jgi:hypothetical protein